MKSFKDKVLEIVKNIPKGEIMTYKQVAVKSGHDGASRAVGMIMSHNDDKSIPCHRVVRSDGSLGGYNGIRTIQSGALYKRIILEKEGIIFTKNGRVVLF